MYKKFIFDDKSVLRIKDDTIIFPHHKAYKEYLRLLADESIIKVNKRVIDNVRDKIKDIPSIEFTFNSNEVLDINQLTPILDKGKDNLHPGPLTHKKVADILTELVKEWK